MRCKNCNEEYDPEMFPYCPYCLTVNEDFNVENKVSPLPVKEKDVNEEQKDLLCAPERNDDKLYKEKSIIEYSEKCNEEEHKGEKESRLFSFMNAQLYDLSIRLLVLLGISSKTINKLVKKKITKIGQLYNIPVNSLAYIVDERNIEKFRRIQKSLEKTAIQLLKDLLDNMVEEDSFQISLMKAEGITLQEIGLNRGISRERVRQIIKKFNQNLSPLITPIIDRYINTKGYATGQEILDLYDNDLYDKILIQWCKTNKQLEYLDFADIFLKAGECKHAHEKKVLSIAVDFIGEGNDLYENMEDLESLLKNSGYPYLDTVDIMNLLQKNGYKIYGSYVAPCRKSYGYLCSRIVAKKFSNGIKLYDSTDLDLLRKYALEEYGDINISDDNRALSARLSDFLVLSGRGAVTASENIHVEMSLLDEIKTFIDNSPEREIYYSHIYSEFEGMLQMMSNIDNYNFLHGVLMMYYPDDYEYTRDYLKKGTGYISGRFSDRISRFILEEKKPVHKKELKNKFTGMSDIVLNNAVTSSDTLFLWDFNYYYSLDFLDFNNEDLANLAKSIQLIMDHYNGYCSDSLLFEYVKRNYQVFLDKNNMLVPNNLYFFCAKKFGDQFDFRRPHIVKKGLIQEISAKNVAVYLLNYPDELSYSTYMTVAGKLMWSAVTATNMFAEIEQDYIRISQDLYIKKKLFDITISKLKLIEECINKCMNYDFVSLMTFDKWEELPDMQYNWNPYLLHSILENYSTRYKIILPRVKDRRYERGLIVEKNCEIHNYVDLIIHMLKELDKYKISESELTALMVINGLAYKIIPHEVYISEKITYKDEEFLIN